MSAPSLFKWRHFLPDVTLLNVRWYCRYALSYRDLEEMMQEQGIEVDHSTINRACVEVGVFVVMEQFSTLRLQSLRSKA